MCANRKLTTRGYFMIKDEQYYFAEPAYEGAVIGETDDGRVVYDYYKMIESLMEKEGMTDEDASDFISYNTIRFAPYLKEKAPLIVDTSYDDVDLLKDVVEEPIRFEGAILGLEMVSDKVAYDYDKLLTVIEKEHDWDEERARNYIIETLLEEGLVVIFID